MTPQKENEILVFYIGTGRLAGMLAEEIPSGVKVLRFAQIVKAEGFQKGEVSHLEKAVASVGELVKRLELDEEALASPAFILLSGSHLEISRFSSSIYYQGYPRVITPQEIRQVVEQTRSVAPLPLENWILQVIPESFWVNDLTGVQDPTGLEAQRLAVTLKIFTTQYASFRNLARVFEALELNVKGYFPKNLTLPEGLLNAEEKEGETLLIDFADDVTHLVLTRQGEIATSRSFEVGSQFFTSKIAAAWRLSLREAERLKDRFGSLDEKLQFGEELIPLVEKNDPSNKLTHQIKRAEFHQVFFQSGEALFSQIKKEVEKLLQEEKLAHPHFVLTGSGAKIEGLLECFTRHFSSAVRLGAPRYLEGAPESLLDPTWSGLVGLLHWLRKKESGGNGVASKENPLARTLVQVKDWLAAYF